MKLKRPAIHILLGVSVWLAFFNFASAEVIHSFRSDIVVTNDGSFTVEEFIQYDFESMEKHGIYRNIRDSHAQESVSWYKKRIIELELLSVSMDGEPVPYVVEPYDGLSIRIGDADKTISGVHEYMIKYSVDGAIATYNDGRNELYWNVTGDEWTVPITSVTSNISAPPGLLLSEQACYRGLEGSRTNCQIIGNDLWSTITATNLIPGEQLTIAREVNLNVKPRIIERVNLPWLSLGILVIAVWLVFLSLFLYRWRTEHKIKVPIIAQYEPLPDFKPMFSGVLIDHRLDPNDVSAGIVYLAEQGFITIKRTEDKVLGLFNVSDYEITLKRPITETETTFQSELLKLLFKDDDVPEVVTKLSILRNNTSKKQKNALLLKKLQIAVVKDLISREYFESGWHLLYKLLPIYGLVICALVLLVFMDNTMLLIEPIMFTTITSFVIFALFVNRYTKKGYEALNHLKGFKEFMSVTDKERFEFHNAPEKSPEQFMAFLPYAIALRVEKKWTKLFDDIQMEPPSWYSSAGTATAFNAAAFSNELGAFTGAFSTSSGSSGGGSSGGGSGGGGGGSW